MENEFGCFRFNPYEKPDREALERIRRGLTDEEKANMLNPRVRQVFRQRLNYYLMQIDEASDITFGGFVVTIPEMPFVESILAEHE